MMNQDQVRSKLELEEERVVILPRNTLRQIQELPQRLEASN